MSSSNVRPVRESLYDRLGGESGVAALVERFYERVLNDPELEPYFRHVPMEKLVAMQRAFFAAALDGPVPYTGPPIHEAHRGRRITSRQLSGFMKHLQATIQATCPNEQESFEMHSRIALYGDQILDGPSDGAE